MILPERKPGVIPTSIPLGSPFESRRPLKWDTEAQFSTLGEAKGWSDESAHSCRSRGTELCQEVNASVTSPKRGPPLSGFILDPRFATT